MRRVPKLLELNALSITLFYLIFATLWILLSDQLLIWITNDPQLISQYQTLKGIFYVIMTGAFLFYLITLSNKKIENEKKRTDKALKVTMTATWSLDLDSGKIKRSEHYHELYGLPKKPKKDEQEYYFSAIHPEDQDDVRQKLDLVKKGEADSFNVDYRVKWPDNSIHWLRSQATLIPESESHFATLAGVVKDVTAQKELEEKFAREKELFESIFQNIPIMIDVNSPDITSIRVNKAYEDITGWTQEEIRDKNIMKEVYPDPATREKAKQVIDEANGEWHEFETLTKEGEKRIQRWANIRLSDGSTVGIGLDVTEQKELQRMHERDRRELQKVYDNIPVFVSLYKGRKEVHRINKYFEDVIGYKDEDLTSADLVFELIPDRDDRIEAERHLEEADGSWLDFKLTTKSGDIIDTTWTVIKVTSSLKMGIGIDTTELKQKERELKDLNKRYKNAEKLARLGHWKRNLKTNKSVVSTGFFEIADMDPEKETITFDALKDIVHEEDWDDFVSNVEKGIEKGSNDFHYRIVGQRTGNVKHIHELEKVEYDEDGKPVILSGTIQDITEELEYQRRLQELTNRYRRAEEIATFGHWQRNVQTDEAVWSQGFYDAVGLEPGEYDTSYESLINMIHPDDREIFDTAFKEALETGSLNVRYRIIKPTTGEVGYYHELAQTEYDEEGEPLLISGTIQDVTEREEFQIKLNKRNEFIETTLENLPIGVAVNQIDSGEATLMNSKFSEIYGWPKQVMKNVDTFFEKVYPDEQYRRKMMDMVRADMASKDPERMSWKGIEITTSSGEKRIVNAKNIPVYDQNLMISTVVDVTAQAEAEKRLAESEHNYRLLFQKSPQPMWIFNPEDLAFVEVNNAAVKHYGYSRKEFQQMNILDIRPESDREEVKADIEKPNHLKLGVNKEWRHIKKNGELIYVTIAGSDIDYFGNSFRLILVNDITKQKEAEAMVLSSLVEGENKERARIARELHDGLGQYLAAANMNFDAVQNDLQKLDERRQKQFKKGLTLLKHAVTETAQISRNLLPRVVHDYGLALAIEALIDNYSSNSDIEITYYHNIDGVKLPRKVELNLYRIAQEGISNAIKYAEASQINVQLIKDELDLILSIDDNGKGFDLSAPDFKPGLGLQTIKTRTGALGGDLELESQPGKGTFLHIIVPIEQNS